ncbi:hypothetical protein [Stigmatella aurantiaca]|uniref:Uncharacterized protein n=1 Tax=Stigmatella aurantiaca (strain DW4/3-1) TaxID=378806 RepID=Q09BR0_STIAD|nr:hypothetical protein [Stigmatella aurantiaca]ADO73980.1 uncharacterized protein STAUR_6223 [Stigmatella aurantiaca DW4/3-1]EAU69153.1 hypothetical protein STIAU_6147 [Stigmatella aurantiaca DW4/3-1]
MKKLLVFAVLLAVGAGAAYHFGYLERLGLGRLRARFIPKDPALLAYFAPDTHELLLVQATELDFRLARESQDKLAQEAKDFHAKTGIDTPKDVDALAVALGLGVVRGHFDWSRLSAHLQSEGYALTELSGVPAAVKPQAADVALDGRYLLIGPRGELEQALARKRQGQGLGDGSPLVRALDEIGWTHGLVGGVLSGSRLASLQDNTGLGAESLLVSLDSVEEGVDLRGIASAGGRLQGEVMRVALEVMRKALLMGTVLESSPEARTLRASLEAATLETDAQGRVRGALRLPYTLADQASANLSQYPLSQTLQTLGQPFKNEEPTPAGPPSVATRPPVSTPTAAVAAPVLLDWKPPVLGLLLLVVALVTMGAQTRPGMFNVLFHPLFLLPFLVATLGVFVFRWTGHAGGAFDVLALPMPEWHRFVSFPVAQTLALSAAVPVVFALLSAPLRWLRRFAAGLGVGFSAYLAVKAFAGTPLPLIPPAYTLFWYAGHALAALLMARLTLPPRRANPPRPGSRARP